MKLFQKIYKWFVTGFWSPCFDYPSVGYYAREHLTNVTDGISKENEP